MEPDIDIDSIKTLLDYDQDAGALKWKADMNRGRISAGTEVGSMYPDGYKRVNLNGKMHMAHRLGYTLGSGKTPEGIVDHIDGNRSNNSLANLRDVTALQNAHNTSISKRNTTGVKGVYFDKYHQKFRARVMVDGKQHHLGLYRDLDAAKDAQEIARKKLHGDYANSGAPLADPDEEAPPTDAPVIGIGQTEEHIAKVARFLIYGGK